MITTSGNSRITTTTIAVTASVALLLLGAGAYCLSRPGSARSASESGPRLGATYLLDTDVNRAVARENTDIVSVSPGCGESFDTDDLYDRRNESRFVVVQQTGTSSYIVDATDKLGCAATLRMNGEGVAQMTRTSADEDKPTP